MKKLAATLCLLGTAFTLSACSSDATYQNQNRTEGGIAVIGDSGNSNTGEQVFSRKQTK